MKTTRDRFRVGMSGWRSMPGPMQSALVRAHLIDRRACPGPWLTAWTAYHLGAPWNYPYCTNPLASILIPAITDMGTWWAISLTGNQPPGWIQAWSLVFHPTLGLVDEGRWHIISAAIPLAVLPKITVPAGSSVLLLPKLLAVNDQVGRGDAHVLP